MAVTGSCPEVRAVMEAITLVLEGSGLRYQVCYRHTDGRER